MSRRNARKGESKKSGALKGPNAQGFLVALLAEVSDRNLTCRVQVSSSKTLRRVFFVQGMPVAFWSDHPEDAFGRRFVDTGLIDGQALRWTQQHLGKEERIEEALVAGQMLDWSQVADEQVRHIEQGVDALSRMKEGEWELRMRPEVAGRIGSSSLPKASLHASLWKGVKKSLSSDQALQDLAAGEGPFNCASRLDSLSAEMGSFPGDLIESLQGGATLEELFEKVSDSTGELFQLIWYLEATGAISRTGGVDRSAAEALFQDADPSSRVSGHADKPSQPRIQLDVHSVSSEPELPEEVETDVVPHGPKATEEDGTPLGKGEEVPVSDWREKEVPDNRGLSLGRAEELMGIGAYAAALSFLEEARFANPNSPEVLAALGWAHYQASGGEETDEAEEYIDLALVFDGEHAKALEYRARICVEQGDMESARGLVGRLIAVDPKNRWAKAQQRQLGNKSSKKRGFAFWKGGAK